VPCDTKGWKGAKGRGRTGEIGGWGGAGGEGYRRDVHALQPVTPPHRGRPQSRFRHRIPGLSV